MYRSRSAEKQLYDRMIFGVFGGILVIFLAVFYWIIAVDSDYRAVLDPVEMSYSEELCTAVSSVAEPADAYYTTVFTFGGSCTLASMLGSRILSAVQSSGNTFLGISLYGQQLLSAISLVIVIVAILFVKFVLEKQKIIAK